MVADLLRLIRQLAELKPATSPNPHTVSVHAGGPPKYWSISNKYIPLGKGNTMKNLSLKLEDDIFFETEKIITKVKKNRNRYINEAIEFYNRLHKRRLLSKQLIKESKLVSEDSLKVLAEFEKLNDEG